MSYYLSIAGYIVGLPLELLIIAALVRGSFREYPWVFAYVIAEFLGTVIEMPLALAYYHTRDVHLARKFALWYWGDETVQEFLILIVVISLIWHATSSARSGRTIRMALVTAVTLFAGISLVVHYDASVPMGRWMTYWTRDLNFGAAILDMVLWAMLIAKRQKDSRILMLSAGLGIMFAGEAIGQSVRSIETHESIIGLVGSILVMITYLAFLYIWWQTFRVPRAIPIVSPVKLS